MHVGTYGFLGRHKRLFDIIDACEKIDNVVLHIYSSVNRVAPVIDLSRKLKQKIAGKDRVLQDGHYYTLKQIVWYLSRCDVNVWYQLPITWISSSGSIREYLAARRPIVAADTIMVEALKDIIQLVGPFDGDALRDAIENYNPDVAGIKAYAEQHTWEKLIVNYD